VTHSEAFTILMSVNVNRIIMEEARKFLEDELSTLSEIAKTQGENYQLLLAENERLTDKVIDQRNGLEMFSLQVQEAKDENARLTSELATMTERAEKAEATLAEIARPYKETLELIDKIKANYKV